MVALPLPVDLPIGEAVQRLRRNDAIIAVGNQCVIGLQSEMGLHSERAEHSFDN